MAQVLCLIPPKPSGLVRAEFDGVVYEFTAGPAGHLVCDVGDETHVEAMLNIPEHFRLMPSADDLRAHDAKKPKSEAKKPKSEAKKPKSEAKKPKSEANEATEGQQ